MKKSLILLLAILLLATLLRTYQISNVPPSLSWDEASIGYDGWALNVDGKDQWGKAFPYIFQSFGEFKYPIHIYATALSIKLFGLSDFSVRFPSALFGIINIALLFFVVKKITNNNIFVALSSSFFLAISPWHIQFSRINWETNFALFFFLLAVLFFFHSFKKPYYLIFSYILFGLTIYTYNAAKIFVPIFVLILSFIYRRELWKDKKHFLVGGILLLIFIFANLLNPQISGLVRSKQVTITREQISASELFKITNNKYIGAGEIVIKQYLSQLSPTFLFISGDKNPRHSIQEFGEFYYFDILLIPLGLLSLLKLKQKWSALLLFWFFLGPLPASLFKEAPHASRAMFSLGGWQIISAFGFYYLYNICKNNFRFLFWGVSIAIFFTSTFLFLQSYFLAYPKTYSQEWQYGYKRVFLDYKDKFKDYDNVVISEELAQPYIFGLYYLKYSPQSFRSEVKYNPKDTWGFSTVESFDNFRFMKVNLENLPKGNLLIFATPKEKLNDILEIGTIKNLDDSIAFYVYQYTKK